jgi:hypothetical protein
MSISGLSAGQVIHAPNRDALGILGRAGWEFNKNETLFYFIAGGIKREV